MKYIANYGGYPGWILPKFPGSHRGFGHLVNPGFFFQWHFSGGRRRIHEITDLEVCFFVLNKKQKGEEFFWI